MPPLKRLHCDDAEWTRRKAAIEEMYVFDRLSQKKIRDKLEEDGFKVTKSELEAQLRFWNVRKNASADVWRYTDHMILKRDQQGKASVVYYNGRKVSRSTLKKERSRYQPDTLTKYMRPASPKIPDDMELWIRTPTPAPMQSGWAETLPWLRFQDKLLPSILLSITRANSRTLHHIDGRTRLDLFPLHRQISQSSLQSVSVFNAELASIMPTPVENEISIRAQLLMQGTATQSFNEHVKLILYRLSNNLIEISGWTKECQESWGQILNVIECSGMTNQSLNLLQEDDLTIISIAEHLFKLCVEFRIHRFSDENQALNLKIISWLLHSGQSPDVLVFHLAEGYILPLHYALRTGEYEFAIELLEAGSDLNKYLLDQVPPLLVLLEDTDCQYFSLPPERVEIFKRLVLQLLDAGASINDGPSDRGPSALALAVNLDMHIADILIQHGAKVGYQFTEDEYMLSPTKCKFTRKYSVMGCATHTAIEQEAVKNIQHLVGHVQRSDHSFPVGDLLTADVLCRAAESGFNKVVEFCCDFQTYTTTRQHTLFSGLCAASYAGHRATCELLLRHGAPINRPDPERIQEIPTPLHFAAFANHPAIIELLCEHGADVSAGFTFNPTEESSFDAREENYMWRNVLRRFEGNDMRVMISTNTLHINPLGAAIIGAEGQKSSSFSTLIDHGAKLPIWAAYHGARIPQDPWLVHSAVEQGADLNWRGADHMTALQRALKGFTITPRNRWAKLGFRQDDCLVVINSLINAGAEITGSEAELLVLLDHWSSDDVSIRLSQDGLGHKAGRLTMLAAVFLTRSIPRIERALAQSLGVYDASALCASVMLAISSGSTGPLQHLISNRPDTAHGTSHEGLALGLAAWYSRIDILEMLLSKIPSSTPAMIPVYCPENSLAPPPSKKGLQAIISESFEDKIPIWHRDNTGNTELLRGSPVTLSLWSQDCLDKLLESDFCPDRLTMSVAVCHGDVKMLEKLAHRLMVDNNHTDLPGPLYLSVELRFTEMTRILLDAGLSPNESNEMVTFGRSPLQQAVEDGNLAVIDLLLEAGADVNAPAAKTYGATALQLAAIKGRLGITQRLIHLGASVNASGAEKHGRTALEGAAEHGRLDTVQFLLDCGANIVGDGCFQYFRSIRFAEQQGNMAVAKVLKTHRDWTSYDHEIWKLFIALDKGVWEELESLKLLIDSSANPEETESPSSSDSDGDSSEKMVWSDNDDDCEHESSREGSFGKGRIGPTEAAPGNGSLGRLEESWEAVLASTNYDNMITEDHIASHIYDDTAWNQRFGHAENEVQTPWNFGPIEGVYGVHTMQGFQITDVNSQPELNHQLPTANQDYQAVWGTLPIGMVDYELRMEEQLFPGMIVDSAWNRNCGTTDWNGPHYGLGTEMESRVCDEILEGDMGWFGMQDHDSQ